MEKLWAILDKNTGEVVDDAFGSPAVARTRDEIRSLRRDLLEDFQDTRIVQMRVVKSKS